MERRNAHPVPSGMCGGLPAFRVGCFTLAALVSATLTAGVREQAERLHSRITGVPPSAEMLASLESLIADGQAEAAAALAVEQPEFYSVTLKRLATPWTNEEQTVFAPLNDYSATIIGTVRDEHDFREILYTDRIYTGGTTGLTPYSTSDNQHYEQLEASGRSLKDALVAVPQSSVNGLPAEAAAGVMTSRAGAKAFFIAGTNRAMLRFTFLNHLCQDMEQMKDSTRSADRIRQDVSRSPGGDSRLFLNNCLGCHAGMDPLAQAYAYYEYDYDADNDPDGINGQLVYNQSGQTDPDTGTRVQAKYHINADTFKYGYVTPDDRWDNYWRAGKNAAAGWSESLPGAGNGAASLGQELSHSGYFASCQVTHAFKAMCLRAPETPQDQSKLQDIIARFQASNYNYKQAFIDSAVYCMGE